VLDGWRIGNAGPERGTKDTLTLKARITRKGDDFSISGESSTPPAPCSPTGWRSRRWTTKAASAWRSCAVAAGLRIVDDWSGFGQRTTASGTVLLDQVPVDAELVVDNWRQRDVPNIQGAARS
jgi:alkylation response protein AidB-like acyl-CoA dehydrogenase